LQGDQKLECQNEKPKHRDNRKLAIGMINVSSINIVLTSALFKYLSGQGVTVCEFMFYRNTTNLLLNFPIMTHYKKHPIKDINNQGGWIAARALVG